MSTTQYVTDWFIRLILKHVLQNMDHLHTINHPSRLHDVRFCKRVIGEGEVLLVAAEDKKLTIYDISNEAEAVPTIIAVMVGHSNRSDYHICLDGRPLMFVRTG
jgi:hypothetical protein